MKQNEKIHEVKSLENDKPIRYKTVGKKTSITMQLMPNDVEVVIFRFSTS